MENRNRNTAILLVIAGLFLLFGNVIGFVTVTGFFIIWIAVHMFQKGETRTGVILLITGIVIIASNFTTLLIVAVGLLMAYYYFTNEASRSKGNFTDRHRILESWKQNSEPWVLRDMSLRTLIGEINLDLSLAINEKEETTINLEGIIGDVDIIVPEEMGLLVEASVLLGEVKIGTMNESGAMNKIIWQSPHYEQCEYKVKLTLSYIIGDIDIKLL